MIARNSAMANSGVIFKAVPTNCNYRIITVYENVSFLGSNTAVVAPRAKNRTNRYVTTFGLRARVRMEPCIKRLTPVQILQDLCQVSRDGWDRRDATATKGAPIPIDT